VCAVLTGQCAHVVLAMAIDGAYRFRGRIGWELRCDAIERVKGKGTPYLDRLPVPERH
jgi:hypothetical protein